MSNYPLHPNATHPPVMTCEIPLEEYESLKRENAELKTENRKLKRALWLARAKEAWSNARWFNLCNPDYVRNRQGFTPNNETQKQMNSIEWARLFYNNYKKLIAKAEEYK